MTALSAQGYGFPDVHPIVWSVPCVGRLQCTTPRWMHVQYLHGIATNPHHATRAAFAAPRAIGALLTGAPAVLWNTALSIAAPDAN